MQNDFMTINVSQVKKKKHGLDCNMPCGECCNRGQNCSNSGCERMKNEEDEEYL